MASWLRLDAGIDNHPDVQEAGPWGLVAFTTLLRLAKESGQGGAVPEKYASGKHLARRSLFPVQEFAGRLTEAVEALEEAGLIVRREGEVFIPGWRRFQEDSTNASRQAAYRERQKLTKPEQQTPEASVTPVTPVTERNATPPAQDNADLSNGSETESNEGDGKVTGSNESNASVTRVTTTGQDRTGQDRDLPLSPPPGGHEESGSQGPVSTTATHTPTPAPIPTSQPSPAPTSGTLFPLPEPKHRRERTATEAERMAADRVGELWRRMMVPKGLPAVKEGAWKLDTIRLVARAGEDMEATEALFRRVLASRWLMTTKRPDMLWVLGTGRERIEFGAFEGPAVSHVTVGALPPASAGLLKGIDVEGLTPAEVAEVEHARRTYSFDVAAATARELKENRNVG